MEVGTSDYEYKLVSGTHEENQRANTRKPKVG